MAIEPEGGRQRIGPSLTLVLGGARSGKSRHAEALAGGFAGPRFYIATAEALDAEMADRIARHRLDRGPEWRTIEAPHALAAAFGAVPDGAVMVIDCLTLWLSNRLLAGADLEAETTTLTAALARRRGPWIVVSNEVGFGIVPDNALARRFRDAAGRLNQAVAAEADRVFLVVAGLPLALK
ncbi:MAG: bifunctional adenosylcobinamide kinase/adenosylcobinamide-phosphate guanylyltransferase [Amaricoccus sp.]